MKIKIPASGGEKPGSTGKVSPSVTPALASTPSCGGNPPRRKAKTCADSWTCCDWVLLSFIIIMGGGLCFKLIAERTIRHKFESMFEKEHHSMDYQNRAECKVVHVQDNGLRSCRTCGSGIRGDQLEHGWWDWMENADTAEPGWGKDGFFRHPAKKCEKFIAFEKRTWEEFEKRIQGQPKEVVLEEKIIVQEMLRKEQEILCVNWSQHLEEWETKGEDWVKTAWEMFEKKMEGKPAEEVAKHKKEFQAHVDERQKLMDERKGMMEGGEDKPHMRQRRGFNKGMSQQKPNSQFPCHEVIVEVNPQGKHKQWSSSEEGSWEGSSSEEDDDKHMRRGKGGKHGPGKGGKHGPGGESHEEGHHKGGHPPHHGRKPGEPKPEHPDELDNIEKELKTPPKDGKDAMKKMHNLEHNFESRMKDMLERGVHHATLYDSKYTAENHRQCSVSICKDNDAKNKKCVGNFIDEYKKMWEEGESFPCYYNKDNKMQVWELEPYGGQMKTREEESGHHHLRVMRGLKIACGAMVILWIILIVTFSIRRCLQCKRECGRRQCRNAQYQTNEPQVVTVDSPTMSDKEKEALGMSPPTPRDVWMPGTEKYHIEPPMPETSSPSAPPSFVTLDTDKTPDFKAALKAYEADQSKALEKSSEA